MQARLALLIKPIRISPVSAEVILAMVVSDVLAFLGSQIHELVNI
jgi:hypothetical protein